MIIRAKEDAKDQVVGAGGGMVRVGEWNAGLNGLENRGEELQEGLRRIGSALHDLCQPLTTLQCRLELAGLVDTEVGYREAVGIALTECARMSGSVSAIRDQVRKMLPLAGSEAH